MQGSHIHAPTYTDDTYTKLPHTHITVAWMDHDQKYKGTEAISVQTEPWKGR